MAVGRLTSAQRDRAAEFVRNWTQIGLAAAPGDRDLAERTLCCLYESAGRPLPQIVWAPCPVSAMLSAIIYTAIRATGRETDCRDKSRLDAFVDRMTSGVLIVIAAPSMRRKLQLAVVRVVGSALRRGSSGTGLALGWPILWRFDRALEASLKRTLGGHLVQPIRAVLVASVQGIMEGPLQTIASAVVGIETRRAAEAYFGSPLWLAYAAQMDYANRVVGIRLDRCLIEAVQNCGLFWTLDGICFVSQSPAFLNRDAAGHLHCETGPSFGYRTGWRRWHWHGIGIQQHVIEAPQSITVEAIERERRAEARRVLIERYRHGQETHGVAAYLRDAGGVRLDHDDAFGTLWCRDMPDAEPLVIVEVVNRSREPDGSFQHYFLRVHPELRPILADGSFGAPRRPTARNAVASTFGLRGAAYAPALET